MGESSRLINRICLQAGLAVRYGIIAALFFIVLLFFVGGYFHAQRRIKKGKQPLAYHRWMLRAPAYNARPYPPPGSRPVYAYYSEPHNNNYQMEGYPPPPPAYHHAEASPPVYAPPPGASKAMADQTFRETTRVGESSGGGMR